MEPRETRPQEAKIEGMQSAALAHAGPGETVSEAEPDADPVAEAIEPTPADIAFDEPVKLSVASEARLAQARAKLTHARQARALAAEEAATWEQRAIAPQIKAPARQAPGARMARGRSSMVAPPMPEQEDGKSRVLAWSLITIALIAVITAALALVYS